ncbi:MULTISPECIES: SprT family zinc-dependent metalloprotease [unclassified Bosea (in: a-proteobacteria)]|uniref:M48 family metallopeptidase n=1 Tax=unclassified Bosea (in: a-proteobacteria) TaxID=2653178 RepID=UPI000F76311F|nr:MULTISPECIES: SprT family zinc-dependent metalloprotease [unclassified Bosea (in: a-proteobacteria)]AZO79792.1 metal-dependent hydrolase [Bosea sp. Tri-49]RXT15952.1 metal-dependent hydrolase [Bosea sp. Tri-39]RXT39643.1 metal-dependent hydrolase [Bosea sp. Tri-54]
MRFSLFRRKPDPDRIEVGHAGLLYPVTVRRRSTARRLTLRVSQATGEITLTLPERVDFATGRIFAEKHGGWIAARLAKRPQGVPFEPGAVVPLRGVPHRIVHWTRVRGLTRAALSAEGEPIIAVCGEAGHVARRVKDFLRREALADLEKSVRAHTAVLGIPARKITLRDTTSRWGSCSSKGHLSFSWRLILAPASVLDYLAAHEVAHLKEMNHSHRFWALTHKLCPRTDDAEAWLKRHGASLHGYG